MYPGFGQSIFSQRQEKDQQQQQQQQQQQMSGMYGPGPAPSPAAGQPNLYGSNMPTASGLSGIQGLSGLHQPSNRAIGNTTQFVSRSNTAPGNYGSSAMGGMTQLGAPSPPTGRAGMMTLGSGRSSLMSTGQGLVAPKPRPSTLSSAIGSALPLNPFSGLGRTVQAGLMSPISSGYNSAFSETGGQSGFDPSEFPMLTLGRSRQDATAGGLMASANALARQGFNSAGSLPVSRVESVPGFQMHSEDFPALPGTSKANDKTVGNGGGMGGDSPEISQENKFPVMSTITSTLPEYRSSLPYDPAPGGNKERSGLSTPIGPPKTSTRKSYQPTTVSIPPGMVQDQFGMMGLLTFIRGAETDPGLVALALGSDLTTLGLNLNSPESLYNTFASPWADSPCRLQDIDYNVPQDYLIHPYVRDKLAPIRLSKYHDDLLFYIYYSNGGDLMQTLAAVELYSRDWRYHKDERLWITRAPGMKPTKQENTYEEGTYCYFDMLSWRKAHKEFRVEYDKLEDRPQLPQNVTPGVHFGVTIPTPA